MNGPASPASPETPPDPDPLPGDEEAEEMADLMEDRMIKLLWGPDL